MRARPSPLRAPPGSRPALAGLSLLAVPALLTWTSAARAAAVVIDDFEDVSDWSGLSAETTEVQQGSGAGRSADVVAQTSVRKELSALLDLSSYSHFGCWLYSTVDNRP